VTPPLVQVYPSADALTGAAAEAVAGAARAAVAARGRFTVALAGGGTPRPVYELLATAYRDAVDWSRVEVFFGDERCVPPDHESSNYRMAHRTLLACVPAGRVHRMRGERAAADAAARYDAELRDAVGAEPDGATFDLVLLGVGADGHTASLFPGAAALDEVERWAVAVQAPDDAPVRDRVTLTFPALDAARHTLVLCAGAAKHHVVHAVRTDPTAGRRYPAARVRALGDVRWMVDEGAGRGTGPSCER
jgi:6-phosphogluconolactonase